MDRTIDITKVLGYYEYKEIIMSRIEELVIKRFCLNEEIEIRRKEISRIDEEILAFGRIGFMGRRSVECLGLKGATPEETADNIISYCGGLENLFTHSPPSGDQREYYLGLYQPPGTCLARDDYSEVFTFEDGQAYRNLVALRVNELLEDFKQHKKDPSEKPTGWRRTIDLLGSAFKKPKNQGDK